MKPVTLDEFIAPISARLGRKSAPDSVPLCDWRAKRASRSTDGLGHRDLVTYFVNEAQKIRIDVRCCNPNNAADEVAAIIAASEKGNVIYASSPEIEKLHIPYALGSCPNVNAARAWNVSCGRDAMIEFTRGARYGITYAAGAVAETGSIIGPCSRACGRVISLLVPEHIAIVSASTVMPTLYDALSAIESAGSGPDVLPSQLCIISGPSVTSDIELVRVEGVHGPVQLHYVLIDD